MGAWPPGFYFGAATSAHQVEGGNNNDWVEWEKRHAARLARAAKDHPPTGGWPDYILNPPAGEPNPLQEKNYISGKACDHYRRFREDFDIAQSLGHNAHRFSIEWSRVEPEEGRFDEKEIEHYRQVVAALRERGLEPFVTLWHWTLPIWLARGGGVTGKKFPECFSRYAKRMAEALPDVRFWITLNETNIYSGKSYFKGIGGPNRRSPWMWFLAHRRLARAHIAAYQAIKNIHPETQIGVAHNFIWFTQKLLAIKNFIFNRWFINSIGTHQDFVGVNYYHSDRDTAEHSEFLNWPIDPEGLCAVIREATRCQKPIYITENGIADARDRRRADFIRGHLAAVRKALAEKTDVRGYFHWSLLDNFEWDKGFWPRFGLVEINYKTLERKIRPSAWVYKKIIRGEAEP